MRTPSNVVQPSYSASPDVAGRIAAAEKRRSAQSTAPTVNTIRVNKDEQARSNKAKESETRLARKTFIANAEASATAFEDAFAKLRDINQQGVTLYQSFKEIAEASREALNVVRDFFAHKKAGELLYGEFATGDAWATSRCGVSYDYVCRCLNPRKEQPLLKAANETAQSSVSPQPKTKKATQELERLADAIPSIRNGKEITPPSEYSAADIVETITRLTDNLVNQRHLTPSDRRIVYTSVIREFQDILAEMTS